MTSKKRTKVLLTFLMALLMLGTASHCIFEDFFTSFSKIVFGAEVPEHLPNHLGSNAPHDHNDRQEPHEHGQPHNVLAIRFERPVSVFLKMLVFFSSICLIAIYSFGSTGIYLVAKTIFKSTSRDPSEFFRKLISSLTIAPQAPPI